MEVILTIGDDRNAFETERTGGRERSPGAHSRGPRSQAGVAERAWCGDELDAIFNSTPEEIADAANALAARQSLPKRES
jgi:hypothetical protein